MNTEQKTLFDDLPVDMYYNTTKLNGIDLQHKQIRTCNQGFKILQFFKANPNEYFTPFDVQSRLNLTDTPITSIRRAITNLTPDYLIKTDYRKPGIYGDLNFTWKLK